MGDLRAVLAAEGLTEAQVRHEAWDRGTVAGALARVVLDVLDAPGCERCATIDAAVDKAGTEGYEVCAFCRDIECDGVGCIASLDSDDKADHPAIERLQDAIRLHDAFGDIGITVPGAAVARRPTAGVHLIHGDCTCERREDGERDDDGRGCPLHDVASTHADAPAPAEQERCPTCGSDDPAFHAPRVGPRGGIVLEDGTPLPALCPDDFHAPAPAEGGRPTIKRGVGNGTEYHRFTSVVYADHHIAEWHPTEPADRDAVLDLLRSHLDAHNVAVDMVDVLVVVAIRPTPPGTGSIHDWPDGIKPNTTTTVCPECRYQFGGKVPGHRYGSNWDWVPCQTCNGTGMFVAADAPAPAEGEADYCPKCDSDDPDFRFTGCHGNPDPFHGEARP